VHLYEIEIFVSAAVDILGVVEDVVEALFLEAATGGNGVVAAPVVVEIDAHPFGVVHAGSAG
jgi:hypothetical protein